MLGLLWSKDELITDRGLVAVKPVEFSVETFTSGDLLICLIKSVDCSMDASEIVQEERFLSLADRIETKSASSSRAHSATGCSANTFSAYRFDGIDIVLF
jgi:hypothetical protein